MIPSSADDAQTAGLNRIAALALVLANVVIVALTLREQWGFLQILYVIWFEALVIGAYNVLKMFVVFAWGNPFGSWIGFANRASAAFCGLAAIVFFVVKFSGFALGMGFFLLVLPAWLTQSESGQRLGDSGQFELITQALKAVASGLPVILLALVASHGVSFVVNFLGRREYQRTNIVVLVFWPYARMALVMVVMVIAGLVAAVAPILGRTTMFAVTVVLLKVLADLASHAFEHSAKRAAAPVV